VRFLIGEIGIVKELAGRSASDQIDMDQKQATETHLSRTSAMRENADICFSKFEDETQLEAIITLISNDLSEPYSIYVYRYFIQQW
jgi:hypothetical protein